MFAYCIHDDTIAWLFLVGLSLASADPFLPKPKIGRLDFWTQRINVQAIKILKKQK